MFERKDKTLPEAKVLRERLDSMATAELYRVKQCIINRILKTSDDGKDRECLNEFIAHRKAITHWLQSKGYKVEYKPATGDRWSSTDASFWVSW